MDIPSEVSQNHLEERSVNVRCLIYVRCHFHVPVLTHRKWHVQRRSSAGLPSSFSSLDVIRDKKNYLAGSQFEAQTAASSVLNSAQAARGSWARHVRLGTITS